MAKKKGNKKATENKAEKVVVENKAEAKPITIKEINWRELPKRVVVIALDSSSMIKGKEYKIGKETAKVLIDNGKAKLK